MCISCELSAGFVAKSVFFPSDLECHPYLGEQFPMKSSSVSGISGSSALIHNELLCYGMNNIHNCTAVSLINCIIEFYHIDEIHIARNLLFDICKDRLSGKLPRRSQPPTDKHTARPFVEDICSWLQAISELHDPVDVLFYALDLRRVPPCAPEEINLFSLVTRIEALERRAAVADPLPDATARPEPTPSGDPLAASAVAHPVPGRHPPSQSASSSAPPVDQVASTAATWATVTKRKKNRAEARRRVQAAAQQLQVVTGTGTDSGLKSCKPIKHLFVYGVDNTCSPDAVNEYMRKKDVHPKEVRRISKDTWFRASFRIAVEDTCYQQTLSADFWPEGIKCREWLQTFQRKPQTSESGVAAPPTASDVNTSSS